MLMGLTVLVVDDEPEILSSLRGLLTQLGCAVRCACNGPQALEAMGDDFAPQLLLVDHRLRAENGIDVIARIRARHGPVPAVLVTGDTEPAIIQAAQAAGHRVVYKPVQGQVLAQVLREVSGGARPAAG
jgi:CheY-like chemotaxis protein